jgi:hypothetical protein
VVALGIKTLAAFPSGLFCVLLMQFEVSPALAQDGGADLSPLSPKFDFSTTRSLPRAQNSKDFSGWKVFNGDKGKIRFLYPNNWVEVGSPEDVNATYLMSFEAPDKSMTGYLIGFPTIPGSKLSSYKNSFADGLASRNKSAAPEDRITLLNQRFARVEGQEMYQGVTKSKTKSGSYNQYTFAVVGEDTLYELVITCKSSEVLQKAPFAMKIGESLRVPSTKVNLEPTGFGKKEEDDF